MAIVEICVDSVESALEAEAGGAHRVELCSALTEGGLTPSLGLIRAVRSRLHIGVHVLIRPRAGDFLYSDDDLQIMRDDIVLAAEAGVDGVVFGLVTVDGDIDVERTKSLVALSRPMEVTFHRALDMTPDLDRAFEDVIRTGADRVLTSGAHSTAMLGRQRIRGLVQAAAGRIRVMAGGAVRHGNIGELRRATGATEFHASLRRSLPSPVRHRAAGVHLGDAGVDEYVRSVVKAADVRRLVAAAEDAVALPYAAARLGGSGLGDF